jgi:hypothetical protein
MICYNNFTIYRIVIIGSLILLTNYCFSQCDICVVELYSDEAVVKFEADYAHCDSLTGTIKYKSEFKPPYLPSLKKFKGTISISTSQGNATNIDGFSVLEHINGTIYISGFDTSVVNRAFPKLKTVIEINMQPIIMNKGFHFVDAGFNNLEYIDDLLLIADIGAGVFFGFEKLMDIRKSLYFTKLRCSGFNGFKNLKVVGRALGRPGENRSSHFNISSCPFLEDLTAFDNLTITPSHSGDYIVRDNPKISACNIPAFCYLLANLKGDILFKNNAPGCNSVDEVLSSCTVGTDENTKRSWIVYPNPATDILYICHDNVVHEISYIITDLLGKTWMETNGSEVDVSELPAGLYTIEVKSTFDDTRTKRLRFVKR